MNKLNKCIRRLHRRYTLKSGGVHRNHPYVHKGHTIYYNTAPNVHGDPETIFINAGRGKGQKPCFNLAMKDGVATLQSLDKATNCFDDDFDNSRELVIAAFSLAKSKGCTAFQLTDNSTKTCHSYKFTLSDMYFVTTGRTWYESILSVKSTKYNEADMIDLRERVRNSTWADISVYLISHGATIDFDFPGLDPNKAGSCMGALNLVAKMRNAASCKFFKEQLKNIMDAHKIKTFHGTFWTVNIDASSANIRGGQRTKKMLRQMPGKASL
jgi:hypothetical protein